MDSYFTDDPVAIYLREVSAVAPLTSVEEAELSQHIWANDEQAEAAKARMVEANLAFVVSIAEKYRDRGVHILDLCIEGNNGLLAALQQFAGQPGTRFSDYVTACVDAAIIKAVEG